MKPPEPPPMRSPSVGNGHSSMAVLFTLSCAVCMALGIWWGYRYPRDVELESTAPVEFKFEVAPEAVKSLVLLGVKGCDK